MVLLRSASFGMIQDDRLTSALAGRICSGSVLLQACAGGTRWFKETSNLKQHLLEFFEFGFLVGPTARILH
jgi:hypothetical protein